ncbi:MAG: glutamyl-tRNA reductase [Terriglobales bacterium]|jgi:glutamyl-tRNA reductase
MEPSLMVVGLNYRTAPVAVRERFWISENRRCEALAHLSRAEGIEEIIVLSTCNRTEFLLWANDVTLAANSVMRLLGAEYGLKLCEWKHFYRLLDEAALLHIFRVTSCLDSMVVGAPQIVPQVKEAWQQAQKVGATGRFLDAVLQKALTVSERVRRETAIGKPTVSIPSTAVELARQIFGALENKKILLIGAGEMCELSARGLLNQGGSSVRVAVSTRTFENAAELAAKVGGIAIPFEERCQHMAEADIIIISTSCPHTILSREEVENIVAKRKGQSLLGQSSVGQSLVIVDLAIPRNVDPEVRNVKDVFLYDLDDLENVPDHNAGERDAAAAAAQKILYAEAQGFRRKLMAERTVPTIVALRQRLDEICRKELDAFREENGPFSKDQDEMLNGVMSRMTQRIAGSLARELKELPEKVEQERMTTALQRLFHLQTPDAARAVIRSS